MLRLLAEGIDVNDVMQTEKTIRQRDREQGTTSVASRSGERAPGAGSGSSWRPGPIANNDRRGFTAAACHHLGPQTSAGRRRPAADRDPGKLSSLDFVRTLVAHGADVNAQHGKYKANQDRLNRTDATPFLLAAETADLPLMRLLLELGAEPQVTNRDKCTPLLAAAGVGVLGAGDEAAGTEEEVIEAVKLLLDLGADINAVDDRGNYRHAWSGLQELDKTGADFWQTTGPTSTCGIRKNKRGWTPLLIAEGHRPNNFRYLGRDRRRRRLQVMRAGWA